MARAAGQTQNSEGRRRVKGRETKEARKERQARELWAFIEVLRRAGNVVEEEFAFDMRPADSSQSPPIPRKWKFDLVMPGCKRHLNRNGSAVRYEDIAIEIEGLNGRHQSTKGFLADVSKYGEAFAQGWVVLRVTRQMIADGTALDILARRGVRVEGKP